MHREHILVARSGYAPLLKEELQARFSLASQCLGDDAVAVSETKQLPPLRDLVFARQVLPLAAPLAGSVADIEETLVNRLGTLAKRSNRAHSKWTLHTFAPDDNLANQTATKLEKIILAETKKVAPQLMRRYISPQDLIADKKNKDDALLVQVYVPRDLHMRFSIGGLRQGISPYIGGNLRMRDRDGAPSRSARKIEEAFLTLGIQPTAGQTAVDLGAAPGGWTFALARRGVNVTAVDAADLKLPATKKFTDLVNHVRDNGLRYVPAAPVDWLVCDMIVAPHETLRVLKYWLEKGLMQNFVINLKLAKSEPWLAIAEALEVLKRSGFALTMARHLFHDRWEITLMGAKSVKT